MSEALASASDAPAKEGRFDYAARHNLGVVVGILFPLIWLGHYVWLIVTAHWRERARQTVAYALLALFIVAIVLAAFLHTPPARFQPL